MARFLFVLAVATAILPLSFALEGGRRRRKSPHPSPHPAPHPHPHPAPHPHPVPHPPPKPSPTPSPSPPLPAKPICTLSAKCQQGLMTHRPCKQTTYSGEHECWEGLKVWDKDLTKRFGCPAFFDNRQPTLGGKAFCWCGLNPSAESLRATNSSLEYDISKGEASRRLQYHDGCHNLKDAKILRQKGKGGMAHYMKVCANQMADMRVEPETQAKKVAYLEACINHQLELEQQHLTTGCVQCFARSTMCTENDCIEECTCVGYADPVCSACMKRNCQDSFNQCTRLKDVAATDAEEEYATDAFETLDSSPDYAVVV